MKRDLTGEQCRVLADLARDIFIDLCQAEGLMEYGYDDELDAPVYTGYMTSVGERVIESRLLKFFADGGNV